MRRNRLLWGWIAACSLLSTGMLLAGLGIVINDMLLAPAVLAQRPAPDVSSQPPPGQEASLASAKEIRIVALGDSLTKGTGDTTGKGYVYHVVEGLKKKYDKPVHVLNNLAVGGMQASELVERLSGDTGYQYAVKQANLILLTIGGNDLFLSARARMAQKDWETLGVDGLAQGIEEALERFRKVADTLYRLNPAAKVVYMGLYNPFYDLDKLRGASISMQEWNTGAYAAIHPYPNMMMVPTFDLFEGRIGEYLSSDHFHPNREGYERIAGRMLESLD
ncbi:GDSL family lipase [Paenibacillus sp. 1011MAR3C5]|uniref:GDSL-type esterase/lipase family protein n=1 Tax=Paenibacillus sp. 1011MAR3C5 TaxID=1675787 RepID=UPI000E6BDD63|nr:GDSL-type esterase/lipase family protein [Paenibacillus sp. 1011MAR3C5]RJE90112.1 GDSL family lipase [Paenibacillus sp. 1011MAR3C5]